MGDASANCLTARLTYGTRAGTESAISCNQISGVMKDAVEKQRLRVLVVDGCRNAMKAAKLSTADKAAGKALPLPAAQEVVKELAAQIESSNVKNEEDMAA